MLIRIKKPSGLRLLPPPKGIIRVSPADTDRTLDEKTQLILDGIRDEAQYLDDETRDLWMDAAAYFEQTGDIDGLIKLTEYRRKVVPLDEFFFGKLYLGMKETEMYPGVMNACYDLDSDQYVEAVLKGATSTGKTTISNIMLGRNIYKISCMRHPQSTFTTQTGSALVFTIQSIRIQTAKKAVFEEFGAKIKHSPYFRNVYPYDPYVTSQMIFREQNVSIIPVAASATGAISMNVLGGILDEMNFMSNMKKSKSQHAEIDGSFSQAKQTYQSIARRRRGRFTKRGKLPGMLFLVSSSRFPDDFTETKAAEASMCGGTDDRIYVYSKATWEVRDPDTYMDERFRVQIGNTTHRSKVLAEGEEAAPDTRVIEVPMDFHKDFNDDVEQALRDFAGATVLSLSPFMRRRDAIFDCIRAGIEAGYENPFERESYDFSLGIPKPDPSKLLLGINADRHCHIDLGLRSDPAGITIGHIAGHKLIERVNPETGMTTSELLPTIGLDVIMRVTPPSGGEIEFADVRRFIMMLRDQYGLPIKYVTFDGFQSADSKQILRKAGFFTDHLSVEKIEEYRTFRDAIYDNRVLLFHHQALADELAGLEITQTNSGAEKVDHRSDGTKDIADSACGVVTFLLRRRAAWSGIVNIPAAPQATEQTPIDVPTDNGVFRGRRVVTRRNIPRRNMNRR